MEMSPSWLFSHIPELHTQIFLNLDDTSLSSVFQVNKYSASLNTEYFWYDRIADRYSMHLLLYNTSNISPLLLYKFLIVHYNTNQFIYYIVYDEYVPILNYILQNTRYIDYSLDIWNKALHTACKYNSQPTCLSLILKYQHKLYITPEHINTALLNAVLYGNIVSADILINAGADIHHDRDTCIIQFLRKQAGTKMLKWLIHNGSDINARNGLPLYTTCSDGNLTFTKLLVNNGADIHVNNEAAFTISVRNEKTNIVKLLIARGANIHVNHDEVLRYAKLAELRVLFTAGIDIHIREEEVFINSIINRNMYILNYMLDNNTNVNARNGEAIITAARSNSIYIIKRLIKHQVDINARNGKALNILSRNGHQIGVKLLLNSGAKVYPKALINAAANGFLTVVKILLENGADASYNGCEACRIAETRNHTKVSRCITKFILNGTV